MDTSDVYEAYVKPKDVKNKWIQTDEVSQGKRKKYIIKNNVIKNKK